VYFLSDLQSLLLAFLGKVWVTTDNILEEISVELLISSLTMSHKKQQNAFVTTRII
jgi:hypothetical protein